MTKERITSSVGKDGGGMVEKLKAVFAAFALLLGLTLSSCKSRSGEEGKDKGKSKVDVPSVTDAVGRDTSNPNTNPAPATASTPPTPDPNSTTTPKQANVNKVKAAAECLTTHAGRFGRATEQFRGMAEGKKEGLSWRAEAWAKFYGDTSKSTHDWIEMAKPLLNWTTDVTVNEIEDAETKIELEKNKDLERVKAFEAEFERAARGKLKFERLKIFQPLESFTEALKKFGTSTEGLNRVVNELKKALTELKELLNGN
jgi:hypothetical protein